MVTCRREDCNNPRPEKIGGTHTDQVRFCSAVCRQLHILLTKLQRMSQENSSQDLSAAVDAVQLAGLHVSRAEL